MSTLNVHNTRISMSVLCVTQQLRVKAKNNAGPMTVARLPINQGRNRYRDVLPGMGWKRGTERKVVWGGGGGGKGEDSSGGEGEGKDRKMVWGGRRGGKERKLVWGGVEGDKRAG